MAGFDNETAYFTGIDTRGVEPVVNQMTANGQLLIGADSAPYIRVNTLSSSGGTVTITNGAGIINLEAGTTVPTTFNADSGSASPVGNELNILGLGETSTTASGNTVSILSPRTAQFVVDPTANSGTHQTIAAAIAAASSGDTIFVRPGTYTENLTLKAGVTISSYDGDAFTPTVTISGTVTHNTAGTCTLSGIRLQTNSATAVAVTGSAASVLLLINCFLRVTNADGITFSSSSSSAKITCINCNGDITTTGIKLFAHTSAGSLFFDRCYFENNGFSITNSTASAGFLFWQYSYCEHPITTSGTCVTTGTFSYFSTFGSNVTALVHGGATTSVMRRCTFKSGTATAISISTALNLDACHFELANADVVSGAGTMTYSFLTVNNTVAWGCSVSTKVVREVGPDMQVGSTLSGGTNTLNVNNDSNTASSNAKLLVTCGGTSAGDPYVQYNVPGATDWVNGIDNSNSDAWVLSASTALGTTDVIRATTAGEVTKPLQPAFLAFLGTTDSNVTGDGDFWLIGSGNALTEVFDQGGDFATTGLFTAPITGRYFMGGTVYVGGLTSAMTTGYMQISASNRVFDSFYVNPFAAGTAGNQIMMNLSCFVDMDAADTVGCYVRIQSGTQVADVIGAANCDTSFFGHLVC